MLSGVCSATLALRPPMLRSLGASIPGRSVGLGAHSRRQSLGCCGVASQALGHHGSRSLCWPWCSLQCPVTRSCPRHSLVLYGARPLPAIGWWGAPARAKGFGTAGQSSLPLLSLFLFLFLFSTLWIIIIIIFLCSHWPLFPFLSCLCVSLSSTSLPSLLACFSLNSSACWPRASIPAHRPSLSQAPGRRTALHAPQRSIAPALSALVLDCCSARPI